MPSLGIFLARFAWPDLECIGHPRAQTNRQFQAVQWQEMFEKPNARRYDGVAINPSAPVFPSRWSGRATDSSSDDQVRCMRRARYTEDPVLNI